MRYKSDEVENLINSLKIEEVVGEFVELKKSGGNYKGLCPFHTDTTPSFMVSPTKNICKCFVCGAGGNPVSFYSQYKKISFMEALEELSKKYNIKLTKNRKNLGNIEQYQEYYSAMNDAFEFYKEQIFQNQGREALEYLSTREVTPKIIRENNLGYAPNGWSELYSHLLKKGHSTKILLELGLIKESENENYYDSFRNRIIFPIYSPKKQVIAFGGRTLEKGKDVPKYINSPDTPIFKKGRNLYGLERNEIIRRKNYSILMEGYMDVLSAYLYGFDVTLAPLGTALTEEQSEILKRYTNNVILSFDQDNAGQNATERAGLILKKAGFNIRVLQLEGAKDPDEYLKTYGKEAFLKCVKNSMEIFDFLFKFYSMEYDLTNMLSKKNFINRFKEFFLSLNDELEKTLYLDRLSTEIDVDKTVLKDILIDNNKSNTLIPRFQNSDEKKFINRVEKDTILLILLDKNNYDYFKDKNIKGSLAFKVYNYMEKYAELDKSFEMEMELSDDEMNEWQLLLCSAIEIETNDEKKRELLMETFLSWFKQEIEESYKIIKKMEIISGIILLKQVKSLEIQLNKVNKFEELLEIYSRFKEIVNL